MKSHSGVSMEFLDSLGLSGRTFKLIYYGHVLLLVLIAMFLLIFVILELTKEKSQEVNIAAAVEDTFHIPNMNELLHWGHNGRGVKVNISQLYAGHRQEYEEGYKRYDLNKYLSDRISMRRPLPDVRSQECLHTSLDLKRLPSVSIVVVFHNEPRTTLLRMLYSIIDRSPQEIIQDIILVDDNSDEADLQYPQLEHYLSVLTKVRIIRLPTNRGTAAARILGAQAASGNVLIFLQPRCECTQGWMTPLLTWIHVDSSIITVPVVDRIDQDTFEYIQEPLSEMNVGSFTWSLATKKRSVKEPLGDATVHKLNPVIADGIFAVDRKNLFKLGGFDEGLMKEDSVNIEFSFRSWMCGSRIILVPCSHVGYIFPVARPGLLSNETVHDRYRIADSWMGSYKYFVYERMQLDMQQQRMSGPVPNASCWNFDWYLKTVEPSMYITSDIVQRGQITMLGASDRILSIGVTDGRVVVQDWISSPITFWYHLKTGVLVTENKTCLSFTPDDRLQWPLSTNLKSIKNWLDSDQNQNHPDAVSRTENISVGKQNQGQTDSNIHQTVAFQDLQPIQMLDQSNESFYRQQKAASKQNGVHQNVFRVQESEINAYHENSKQQMVPETRMKSSSNLQELDVTWSLSKISLSRMKLQTQNQQGGQTFTEKPQVVSHSGLLEPQAVSHSDLLEPQAVSHSDLLEPQAVTHSGMLEPQAVSHSDLLEPQAVSHSDLLEPQAVSHSDLLEPQAVLHSDLVVKACQQDDDDEQESWIYTESKTLQHVKSGLCMEAQKSRTGQFFLSMVQCDNKSWVQRWRFISRLSD